MVVREAVLVRQVLPINDDNDDGTEKGGGSLHGQKTGALALFVVRVTVCVCE